MNIINNDVFSVSVLDIGLMILLYLISASSTCLLCMQHLVMDELNFCHLIELSFQMRDILWLGLCLCVITHTTI